MQLKQCLAVTMTVLALVGCQTHVAAPPAAPAEAGARQSLITPHMERLGLTPALLRAAKGAAAPGYQVAAVTTNLIGANFAITATTEQEEFADVVYNPVAREFLVVWQSYAGDPNAAQIYAQRVSEAGAPLGGRIAIATAAQQQYYAKVAYNPAGNEYMLAWVDTRNRSGDSRTELYARRLSAAGALVGAELLVTGLQGSLLLHDVTYNSSAGEYLLSWTDTRAASGHFGESDLDVYAQRVSAAGALAGGAVAVCTAAGVQDAVAAVHNPVADEYFLLWSDGRAGDRAEIHGQRFSAAGAPVGAEIGVSTGAGAGVYRSFPNVAYNATIGEYMVVWDERNVATGDANLYGRRLSSLGALLGSNLTISTAAGAQVLPHVGVNTLGTDYFVTWTDLRNDTGDGNMDLYGQHLTLLGALRGAEFAVSNAAGPQIQAPMAYSAATDEYLLTWQDGRSFKTNGYDIYAQRLSGQAALTPLEQTLDLLGAVTELIATNEVGLLSGNSLLAKLNIIANQITAGNEAQAITQLQNFIASIQNLINQNKLDATEGQPLIDGANDIITSLSS